MSICDSEENRKKLAWLVPGYILLAWFFCVLFQPLGIRSPNSRYHPRLTKYGEQIIYLTSDDSNAQHCRNNGSVITLEMGQRSAVVIRLGRIQHHMDPFLCTLQIKKGKSLDGISAYVEEIDLPEYHDDTRKPGGHWGSFVCHDFIKLWTGEPEDGENAKKLCGRWSAFDHEGHGTGALETVPLKAMVDSCQDNGLCHSEIYVHIEMDGGIIDGHGPHIGLSLRQRKDFVIVFTGYKNTVATPAVMPVTPPQSPPPHAETDGGSVTKTASPETETSNETETTISGKSTGGGNGNQKNASVLFTCGKEEHKCRQSDYDDHRRHQVMMSAMQDSASTLMPSRCIWSKLRCDYHQNCGRGHESDEAGCGYLRRVSGIHERLSPWSVSTMSLLIIVYLAIVLILVLVTMLLLRWHKVLRTPLDVLSDSRVHQSPPMVMEDRDLAAAHAAAAASSTVTPATVSIMVMYRPHKPRGLSQPSTVELPPSYESLFMGDSPPSYNIAANDAENDDPDHDASEEQLVVASSNPNPGQNQLQQQSVDDLVATTTTEDTTNTIEVEDDSHCDCDCDHSRCINASNLDQDHFVQDK